MRTDTAIKILGYTILILASAIILVPIVWTVISSFKAYYQDLVYSPVPILFFVPSLVNYVKLFTVPYLAQRNILNSLIISGFTTGIAVGLGTFSGYALSRLWRSKFTTFFILSIRFLPPISFVVPLYLLYTASGLLDTYPGLILAYTAFNVPFALWLIRGFIEDVPTDLDDSMIVDGYSRLQTIRKIILPLAAPGIAVTALFTFIFVWNEFLIAFVLTRASTSTLAVFIVGLNTNFGFEWELLFATTVIQMVPMLLVVIFLQRYIARGLTFGAVK